MITGKLKSCSWNWFFFPLSILVELEPQATRNEKVEIMNELMDILYLNDALLFNIKTVLREKRKCVFCQGPGTTPDLSTSVE